MNKLTKIIKKTDELVEAVDNHIEAGNDLIDALKTYQEWLEEQAKELK